MNKKQPTRTAPGVPPPAPAIDPVLRTEGVLELIGVSRGTLRAWVKDGRFPPPLELGKRARGWRRSTVERWLAEREPG